MKEGAGWDKAESQCLVLGSPSPDHAGEAALPQSRDFPREPASDHQSQSSRLTVDGNTSQAKKKSSKGYCRDLCPLSLYGQGDLRGKTNGGKSSFLLCWRKMKNETKTHSTWQAAQPSGLGQKWG